MKLGVKSATSPLVVAMVIAFCAHANRAQAQEAPPALRLTLSTQSPWQQPDGWCRFTVDVSATDGAVSSRCGPGALGGAGSAVPDVRGLHRSLTESERSTVRRLYASARLFEVGHIGSVKGYGTWDAPFVMLMVGPEPSTGRVAALVVTQNPSFASGPPKALVDWLLQERMTLEKTARSKK